MVVKITYICKCCHNTITKYININTTYEAECIQHAINNFDNHTWKIEENMLSLRVW